MPTTVTAPAPIDPADAAVTSTRIATVGRHSVTGLVQALYFPSAAELEEHLALRDNRATNTVFDLDRATGEWVERAR